MSHELITEKDGDIVDVVRGLVSGILRGFFAAMVLIAFSFWMFFRALSFLISILGIAITYLLVLFTLKVNKSVDIVAVRERLNGLMKSVMRLTGSGAYSAWPSLRAVGVYAMAFSVVALISVAFQSFFPVLLIPINGAHYPLGLHSLAELCFYVAPAYLLSVLLARYVYFIHSQNGLNALDGGVLDDIFLSETLSPYHPMPTTQNVVGDFTVSTPVTVPVASSNSYRYSSKSSKSAKADSNKVSAVSVGASKGVGDLQSSTEPASKTMLTKSQFISAVGQLFGFYRKNRDGCWFVLKEPHWDDSEAYSYSDIYELYDVLSSPEVANDLLLQTFIVFKNDSGYKYSQRVKGYPEELADVVAMVVEKIEKK